MMFNHLQLQDGVCRSAIAIANLLAKRDDVEVTLLPLYRFEKDCLSYIDKNVRIRKCFGFYFRGFPQFLKLLPKNLLYGLFVGKKYNVDIAFQYGYSQNIIAAGVDNLHKSVSWIHTYDKGLVYRDCYKKIGNIVHVAKCNVQLFKNEMQDDTVNVDYNYNPIDDELVRRQGQESISIKKSQGLQFVSVGRMSPEKGYKRLLNCIGRLKNEGYIFSLWLVGDGPQLQELKNIASQNGIGDYVAFLGRQDNPHSYTAKADVFVCSSTSEGYSTACTEAIMLNVPVITTNVSGAQEIIEDAECGEVFDSTEDAIYKSMKNILENPTIVARWKDVLQKTKYKFSPAKRFERFLHIVELG